jgi:uncharacterized protein (TIGR02246 family)
MTTLGRLCRGLPGLALMLTLQSVAGAPDSSATAIEALAQRYVDAWNRADASGIASLYVDDGDLITPDGTWVHGHASIQAFYASVFKRGYAGSRSGMEVKVSRNVAPGVVVVDGTWFIENAHSPAGAPAPKEQGVATLIAVETSAGWRVSAVREQTSATTVEDMLAR